MSSSPRRNAVPASLFAAALGLFSILVSNGCTPNMPVVPSGPENLKTGYSATYRINGRTDLGEVEAAGGIPSEGNVTFRAAPVKPAEPKEAAEESEHKKD